MRNIRNTTTSELQRVFRKRLKKSGVINDAIIQNGRKIIIDVEKALELLREEPKNRKIMFELVKNFYFWAEENSEKVKPYHWAIYMVAVEKCNQLGWKQKFGFPTYHAMEILGISSEGLIKLKRFDKIWVFKNCTKAKNQHQSVVISLVASQSKNDISEDTAMQQHDASTALLLRHNKTYKDFKDNKDNKEFLKNLISENNELMGFLYSKTTFKDAEIKTKIDEFLTEKFSVGENQKSGKTRLNFNTFQKLVFEKNRKKKVENNYESRTQIT